MSQSSPNVPEEAKDLPESATETDLERGRGEILRRMGATYNISIHMARRINSWIFRTAAGLVPQEVKYKCDSKPVEVGKTPRRIRIRLCQRVLAVLR